MADPAWSNVSALLPLDGSNGSTTILDTSSYARTLAASGGASISTAQSQSGGASLSIDGGATSYVLGTNATGLDLPGDFCVEFFSRKSANGANGFDIVVSTYDSSGDSSTGWWLELSNSRGFFFGFHAAEVLSFATNPNDSTMRHWAIYRSGTTIRMARAGVIVATATGVSTSYPANRFMVGNDKFGEGYNGFLDNLRITRGEAVYGSSNFTPPTGPFPETRTAAGASSGTGAASGVGRATKVAAGASSGVGAASGAGRVTAAASGAAAAAGVASGTGLSTAAATAAASGTSTVTSVGVSTAAAVGSASATGAALASGQSTYTVSGSAAGTAEAIGVFVGTAESDGTAAGVGAANGAAIPPMVGVAAGVGSASAVGESTASSTGLALGFGSAIAFWRLDTIFPRTVYPVHFGTPIGPNNKSRTVSHTIKAVRFGYPTAFHIEP